MSWVKRCASPAAASREEAGLRWLAQAPGGPAVVGVLDVDGARLTLERIDRGRAGVAGAHELGGALARMHAAGAPGWGAAPPGCTGDGTIGAAVLATPSADDGPESWGVFYATYRLVPHLDRALRCGRLTAPEARPVREVIDLLVLGDLDHPQPELVGTGPARLHGDLWNGNVLWRDGAAVLIDPAAQGGHAETDLAMLDLFGAPFLDEIRAAYDDASPLAPGGRARIPLHQLHPLLVHAELFGGDYGPAAARAALAVLRG